MGETASSSQRSCAPPSPAVSAPLFAMFERLETVCATAVERAFAIAFPTPIEPVQIARKLVAAFESGAATSGRGGRRFHVRLSAADHARFASDLPYLQTQWATMLARLCERSGRPQRPPDVVAERDPAVTRGTVTIVSEGLDEPERLALRVRRGIPLGAQLALDRALTIGRDLSCDLVLVDPRVSRRHLAIDGASHFADLGSANGTLHNGAPVAEGTLGLGDLLLLGDSELVVVGAA